MKKRRNYLSRDFSKVRTKDAISKKKRSELMSRIHSKGTRFEQEFLESLRKITKKKFQTNVTSIKGKPDIVFNKEKVCIFLDSDFWHGWYYPRWKHLLKNDFWREKIENNRNRDKRTTAYLRKNGWIVLRIWGHQIKTRNQEVITRITENL
jgi:DNA mismatch endonuclease (patch repair protein)